ncbi:hypothetical protein CRG98_002541 [Punica granatum]|uniref:ABC-type xenobiotic transporter n=1 Tax=Punica granatum TaxID=22663 RepID=A0A2I0L8K7_PUNGR|nr:hypothetical protein CRG98_002541 [Punica granatum]
MQIPLQLVDVGFVGVFLTWGLMDILKRRTGRHRAGDRVSSASTVCSLLTVVCNFAISLLYLCFCFYEYWEFKRLDYESVSSAVPWILASAIAVYCRSGWPLVLILWWAYSTVLSVVSVSSSLIARSRSGGGFSPSLVGADVVDIVSCALCIILSSAATGSSFCGCTRRETKELDQPLLARGSGRDSVDFDSAGVWSRLTFQWLNPLFKTGRVQKLELAHIPWVPRSESAEFASTLLEASLRKQKTGPSSLSKAILLAVWRSMTVNGVIAGINTVASFMGPFLITHFVKFLSAKRESSDYLYGLVLALVLFSAKNVESLTQRQWYFGAQRIGVRVRAGLMVLIYKKSLSIKHSLGLSGGKNVNLINVDVERIGDFCWYIHGIWLLPVQVFLALAILHRNLGPAPAIAALSSTVLVMVSNTPLANRQEMLHSRIMDAKDSRIKATSETLKSMRVLKLHSWEPTFLKRILKLREAERNWLKKYLYTCSAVAFLFWASPTLVSVATFSVCIIMKTPLSAGTALSALATFRILQEPIYNLPELISMIAQTKVSMDRIQEFVQEEDQKRAIAYHNNVSDPKDIAIEIEPGEYTWNSGDHDPKKPAVKISSKLKIMKGWKVAVCGTAGAGTKVRGTKAYVPQSAWIQTGTIRDNILFGRQMNPSLYENVLESCALKQDIAIWSNGDLSVVGERGMNLSGGQKQRIQLARAVYSESDIYFLDDPFSAVDAHTGTHLFKQCLMQLLSQKTVIYSTHQLEFLSDADLVLVMKDGRIVQSGKYEDLIGDLHSELVRQLAAHQQSLNQVTPTQEHKPASTHGPSRGNQIEAIKEELELFRNSSFHKASSEEESETGRVKWKVYSIFITYAYKGALVPVILLCQVLFQGLQMGSNYWIAWATEEEGRVSRRQLISIFALLSGGSSIFILGRAVLLATIAIETAQHLFLGMISSVFRAPISFFDSTPSSRILNRASTDQSVVDTDIPYRLAGLVFALIQLLSIIILMSQVAWQVFILFLVILGISMWYQTYYITTARELARMVGIRKAPILHHFSESIIGAATIRCFGQQGHFLRRCLGLIDDYSRVAFHNCGAMEWLCVRINFLFNFVFFVVLVILVSLPRSAIDPSLAGLVATYGLNLNVLQAWVIWNLCNVENKMISVERILQFSNIPSEAPLVIEDFRPSPEWPSGGNIELEDLHVQYKPALPIVLRGITCTFPREKKVGIVGRTGSGKSTLIQALFRVVEPARGRILIDGVDIGKMGLQDLRSRLSIIPQDPILFQGTVRANLDPLQQHSDQEIWEVLKKCHLEELVRQDMRLLEAPVAEDGENWSVGQRQLVCLARVLLQKRRILVLDEATASIDTATDNVIQRTIRGETGRRTVLTVAHRIPTVIDNDLVLVLDEGKVIEYDSPKVLLEDKSSSFSKLVAEYLRRSSNSSLQ